MRLSLNFILALLITINSYAQENVPLPMQDINKVIDLTTDSLSLIRTARPVSGSSRKGNNPVLFLIGNSTMRTGTLGNGNNGQWGWGYFAHEYFDEEKITVENHALGGTSSRTFYNNFWPEVLKGIKKDDWVIIELGHNDNGPYDSGRARASIPGIGYDTLNVTIKETGKKETVVTYGAYLRRFINETKAKGAHPILFTLTPRNAWDEKDTSRIAQNPFSDWIKQVAATENIPFIDLNKITAQKYEQFDHEKVSYMFYLDRIHTSTFGARLNAVSAIEGIRSHPEMKLSAFLKPANNDTVTGSTRKNGNPVLFTIGDSTVKNKDKDEKSDQWGWGSVIAQFFNPKKISIENHAMAGRSARTYLNEGRWDKVYNALQPGDFVLIQFGHNDGGEINTGKARGELHGSDNNSKVFKMEATGQYEVVYSFGWYIRKFIMDTREKGAIPIVLSHTPRNKWKDGKIERNNDSYGRWSQQAAQDKKAYYIDLNKISADKLEKIGSEKSNLFYQGDHTHTSYQGALMNAQSIVQGLKKTDCHLKKYVKKNKLKK